MQVRRRGTVIVLSDFYDDPAAIFAALNPFIHRGFRVHLFHLLSPEEWDLGDGAPEPSVADELPHVGPVFLLHSGVVVFAIGPASREADGLRALPKVVVQVPVQKLAAIVAVEPEDGEGQRFFHFGDSLLDAVLAFVPARPRLGPLRVHVGHREAPDSRAERDSLPHAARRAAPEGAGNVAAHAFPAVGDGVRFQPAGLFHIPMLGAHGAERSETASR